MTSPTTAPVVPGGRTYEGSTVCGCGRKKMAESARCKRCHVRDGGVQQERGSLASRAGSDKELRKRIKAGQEKARLDQLAMENWHRSGFVSYGSFT